MQTFLPYPDFRESARVLDNKRLGKQRVECLQILQTLAIGPYQKLLPKQSKFEFDKWASCSHEEFISLPKKQRRRTPWYNHPACRMWRGHEDSLRDYATVICLEWKRRGFHDTCLPKIQSLRKPSLMFFGPHWLGNKEFHASHRSNLLRKDFAWYSQFGWTEPTTLEYVWPV